MSKRQRLILGLFEQFRQATTTFQLALGRGIQIAAELGKGGQFAELAQLQLQTTGNLLHGPGLGGTTDTAYGNADVQRRANTGIEEIALQENLTVGDGNHVGGNIGRNIAGLGLDHRQRSQAAATFLILHARRAFQQTAVQIEDITGIGLTSGRAAQQQRDLAIGLGMLGEIVEDDRAHPCPAP